MKKNQDVQAENYFQVKFINCYLREIISFTKKIDIRDLGQSNDPTLVDIGIAPIMQLPTCVMKYSNIQGRSSTCNVVKVIFHTIRNCP